MCNRTTSWSEAQRHCQSFNMTLFQFDEIDSDFLIQRLHYNMAHNFRDVMFLGLTRNNKVCLNIIISFVIRSSLKWNRKTQRKHFRTMIDSSCRSYRCHNIGVAMPGAGVALF